MSAKRLGLNELMEILGKTQANVWKMIFIYQNPENLGQTFSM